jgi:hypothetical protein
MASIMRVRASTQGSGFGHPALFQVYWRPGTSGGSQADANDVLARFRAAINGATGALGLNFTYTFSQTVDVLDDATGALTARYTAAAVGTVAGVLTSDNLGASTALLVRARTNLVVRGRLLAGRHYVAGMVENQSDSSGRPVAGTLTTWNTVMNGMLTGGATTSFPVVWSRPTTPGGSNGTSGPVVAYGAEGLWWGQQRGRRF